MSNKELPSSLAENITLLERSLSFKQLQINRLLDITQAINDNLSAAALYAKYKEILSWEMCVEKFLLVVYNEQGWEYATHHGLNDMSLPEAPEEWIPLKTKRMTKLSNKSDDPTLSRFEIVVPVFHKEQPIAFTFLAGLSNNEDVYAQVQFITTITNIISVAIENKRLFKRQLEQEKFKYELALAAEVQNLLVPSSLPQNELFSFDGIYMPHHGVGGDYYDFIELDESRFMFCIADISGKGVAAALLMANVQAHLRALIHRQLTAEELVEQLNKIVLRIMKGEKFVTFFMARYHKESQELLYINAGHTPPIVCTDGEVTRLTEGCTILGAFDDLPFISTGKLFIEKETFILTYTDGLTDLQNEKGEYFEDDHLIDFVKHNAHLNVKSFNKALMTNIKAFKGTVAYPDDISVLTCKIGK